MALDGKYLARAREKLEQRRATNAQEQQRRDLARKKEYLRRADESCRTVLHQCRAAGGYLGPLPY